MSINEIFATIQGHMDVFKNGKDLALRRWAATRLVYHSQLLANAVDAVTDFAIDQPRVNFDKTPIGVTRTVEKLKSLIEASPRDNLEIRKYAVELESLCSTAADSLITPKP